MLQARPRASRLTAGILLVASALAPLACGESSGSSGRDAGGTTGSGSGARGGGPSGADGGQSASTGGSSGGKGGTGTGGGAGTSSVCPSQLEVFATPAVAAIGQAATLSANLTYPDQGASEEVEYAWSSSGGDIQNATSPSAKLKCTDAGTFEITLELTAEGCEVSARTTVVCTAESSANEAIVTLNEVVTRAQTGPDWAELYNAGREATSLAGWVVKTADGARTYELPADAAIEAGGYYVIEQAAPAFALEAPGSFSLYDDHDALVETYRWNVHATTSYGRCPNGSGDFAVTGHVTRGAANDCAQNDGKEQAWPGPNEVELADDVDEFGMNLSGLAYEPGAPAVLWAVLNEPGTLYRLLEEDGRFRPDPSHGWRAGKKLHFGSGGGNPDAEGVTLGAAGTSTAYVVTERDAEVAGTSRLSVLSFDLNGDTASLDASHEWNLTSDLPKSGSNTGLESITFVPDEFLVAQRFYDEAAKHTYAPLDYESHGGGLFLVALENGSLIYAYALDHTQSTFRRVASFESGSPSVMDLSFDREVGYLWAQCDETCNNQSAVLGIDTRAGSPTLGRFFVRRRFDRPSTLPNTNNEGIAIGPEADCEAGFKSFFWTDDSATDGHSIRRDRIPCGAFLTP